MLKQILARMDTLYLGISLVSGSKSINTRIWKDLGMNILGLDNLMAPERGRQRAVLSPLTKSKWMIIEDSKLFKKKSNFCCLHCIDSGFFFFKFAPP